MKRVLFITLLAVFLFQGFSQEVSAGDRQDTSNLREDSKRVAILESLEADDTASPPEAVTENEFFTHQDDDQDSPARRRSRFKGHWAGIEVGLNNYATSGYTLTLPDEINYMSLHSGKSRQLNLNFGQLSIGLGRHIGFVTGLGINWSNYRFDGNNNIQKGASGVIEILDPGAVLKKSKLSTYYLKVPLLFEVQIPTDHHRLNISAGAVGAVKLGSNSVMVFEDKNKVKSGGDFNLNLLRYGATARIGYENINIYGTYYFTPLFEDNMGPGGVDLFPFEIGVAFTIDD